MTRIRTSRSHRPNKLAWRGACLVALVALCGCGASRDKPAEQPETPKAPPLAVKKAASRPKPAKFTPKPVRISAAGTVDFDINWPPRALAPRKPSRRSLLNAQLFLRGDPSQANDPKMTVTLTITRPHASNADRRYWNASTAFEQYKHWMPYVRGRDASGKQWLWPNLSYLFKLHGTDRVERYGGWDPGHKVDNDFGAVLIRKLTNSGQPETEPPLVSADWHGDDAVGSHVVHIARSDTFTLHVDNPAEPSSGQARVCFIYGDFMDWRPPWKYASGPMKNRPLKMEHSGGIIAQFRIDWTYAPKAPFEFTVTQETPHSDTGFNWKKWIARRAKWARPQARPKLTDHPDHNNPTVRILP
jgi:hypothetical protein